MALLRNRGSTSPDVAAAVLDGVHRCANGALPSKNTSRASKAGCNTRDCIMKRIEMLKADGDSDVLHPGAQRNGLAPRACARFSHASLCHTT